MADSNDKHDFSENPFVGPHPIETGRNIFGRNREIDDLYYLLSAERIVMLHSPSGAGKTSLIQAGLIPRLNERFDVWGPTRVNQLPSANSPATLNRYIRSAVLGFEQQIPAERRRTEDQLIKMTLAEYVASRREESKKIVLIFDQFEEILTADPLAIDAKREFFKQLGELLLDPRIWALFAMREDYLPALDPYAEQVPTHLKSWFRLDLLRRDKATEAITETAKEGGRQFDAEAVTGLVTDLATMKVQQPDGTFAPQKGLYVEPLQLQVVCRRLWERMPADKQTIDLAEIEQSGDVTTALADYYAAEVARLADGDVRVERKLREWVGEKLITRDDIRTQVLRDKDESEGLGNDLIASLVNTHLVRGEQREGATWYELAHDRLIEPIRNNNRDWFDAHLHKVQKLASLWEKEGRPDGLLFLDAELIEANEWAEQNEVSLTPIECKFLEASAAKQDAIEKEERQTKRLRRLLALMIGLALLALLGAGIAWTFYRTANEQRSLAQASESKAILQEGYANTAREEALAAAKDAEAKRLEAEAATLAKELQNKQLQTSERNLAGSLKQSDSLLYIARGLLTQAAIDQKNYFRAEQFLMAMYPEPGANDLRGFEWFYLWRQLHDEKMTLKGHQERVTTVVYAPNGRKLASLGYDGMRMWDVESGRELYKVNEHRGLASVAFAPDGQTVASGDYDGTVKLWEVANGKEKATLKKARLGSGAKVCSVAFTQNGRMLASGDNEGIITLWDVAKEKEMRKWKIGNNRDSCLQAFAPDGQILANWRSDGVLELWDVVRERKLKERKKDDVFTIYSMAFAPNGRTLATGWEDGTVRLWEIASMKELKLKTQQGEALSLAFAPEGQTLASGGANATVKLWDVASGKQLRELKGHGTSVEGVAFAPNGLVLATSGGGDKTVKLWDIMKAQESATLIGDLFMHGEQCTVFSPDLRTVAIESENRTIELWDVASGKQLPELKGHGSGVEGIAFAPNGLMLASGHYEGTIKLWDVMKGKELGGWPGHKDSVRSVAFAPNGRMLASGGEDKTVKLWDVATRALIATFDGHKKRVTSLAFAPDGLTLVSGSADNTVKLWSVVKRKRKELHELKMLEGDGDGSFVTSVVFAPKGHTLASGSSNGTVKLWNVRTGKVIATLKEHIEKARSPRQLVTSLAFAPDGLTLVTGGEDGNVKLWDVSTGLVKVTMNRYWGFVQSVAFSPDGRTLASGGPWFEEAAMKLKTHRILLWHAATDAEVTRDCIRCGRKD